MSAEPTYNIHDALDAALTPADAPTDGQRDAGMSPSGPSWIPTSTLEADWVARKARKAEQAIAQLQADRDAVVAYADAFLEAERHRHDKTIAWAKALLEVWLRSEIAADDAKRPPKSRKLPCGAKVSASDGQPKVVVENEDAFIDWMKEHRPDLVTSEVVWKYSKAEVSKQLRDDLDRLVVPDPESGEIVEAVGAWVERTPRFTLDTGGGA